MCEECGRYILPTTHQKNNVFMLTLYPYKKQAILQWLEAELKEFTFKDQSAEV